MIWDHRQMSAPKIDENGRSLRLSAVVNPPTVRSLGSASWNSEAERLERDEQAHGTYYWHEDHGRRFVHFADNWGDHWFGFQKGDSFFWLRNHMGRWWWHDPVGNRWLFWANGSWCWQNPVTFEIVYVGSQGQETPAPAVADANAIYPAQSQQEPPASEDSADASQLAAPVVASEGAPADAAAPDQTFYSGDRTRMVAIYGADHDALLFDTSGAGDPVYLADLAQGVRDADFFQAKPGDPLDIVLFMEDGSLQRFGADGKPFDSANGTDPAGATDLSAPPFGASEQAPIDAGLGPAD